MLSMRAKCFSCDSHPEIGSRAGRRRERQVLSVHVDHQSKVYFSYCPPAMAAGGSDKGVSMAALYRISNSSFNVKCFH